MFEEKSLLRQSDICAAIIEDLSENQGAAFKEFREKLRQQRLRDRPDSLTQEDVCDGINDDATLLRFLRARSYVVDDAVKQFTEAFSSRSTANLWNIYEIQEVEDFEETRKLYSNWTGRRDKRGFPILILDVDNMNSKAMSAYAKSCKSRASHWPTGGDVSVEELRSLAFHDDLIRFILPLCSAAKDRPKPKSPVTKTVHIADISTLGLRQFWNLKSFLLNFAKLLSTTMPETLDTILVIGAPSYFPTIFTWVKKFIDPGTVNKLNIIQASEVLSTLQSYIDMDNIPKRYGGNFDFEHGMPVSLDPKLRDMLAWSSPTKKYPTGPLKWIQSEDGSHVAVATGRVGAKKRYEKVAVLKTPAHEAVNDKTSISKSYESSHRTSSLTTQSKSVKSTGGSLKTNEKSVGSNSRAGSSGHGAVTSKSVEEATDSAIGMAISTDERRRSATTSASDRTIRSSNNATNSRAVEGPHGSRIPEAPHTPTPSIPDGSKSPSGDERSRLVAIPDIPEKFNGPLQPAHKYTHHARAQRADNNHKQDHPDTLTDDADEFHDAADYHVPPPQPHSHSKPLTNDLNAPAAPMMYTTAPPQIPPPLPANTPICTCTCTCSANSTGQRLLSRNPAATPTPTTTTTTTITITIATSAASPGDTTISIVPASSSSAAPGPSPAVVAAPSLHRRERRVEGVGLGGYGHGGGGSGGREREREREE